VKNRFLGQFREDEGTAVPIRTCEVIVRGRLSPALLAAFGDFEAADVERGLTRLIGLGADQVALHRLFRLLQDLNVELVSVNHVDEAPPTITPNG
jgi:hypothetical protein